MQREGTCVKQSAARGTLNSKSEVVVAVKVAGKAVKLRWRGSARHCEGTCTKAES